MFLFPIALFDTLFTPSPLKLYFQALNSKEPHMCLVRDISNCWAPKVETAITKVRTPVMNSEAKVLVPGLPGHRAAIKPAPPQTEEVESKRKLGEKEASIEERLGALNIDSRKEKGTNRHLGRGDGKKEKKK